MAGSSTSGATTLSKNRTDKAGDRLRKMELSPGEAVLSGIDYDTEMEVLKEWRLAHSLPMRSTRSLLRTSYLSVIRRTPSGAVFSRLKREEQIIAKLCRMRTRLSTIEDIGGCRAIVSTEREARALAAYLEAQGDNPSVRMTVRDIDDYIATPQDSGYRGIHLHCVRDGRQVEIQVRTRRQHSWADFVEALDGAFGVDSKHGDAPEQVLDALRSLSHGLNVMDTDGRTIYAEMTITNSVQALQSSLEDLRAGRGEDHA